MVTVERCRSLSGLLTAMVTAAMLFAVVMVLRAKILWLLIAGYVVIALVLLVMVALLAIVAIREH